MNALTRLSRIPGRMRLAYQLLREYEAECPPMNAAEAMALIMNYAEALGSGRWERGKTSIGASAWKEAVERKAPLYGQQ